MPNVLKTPDARFTLGRQEEIQLPLRRERRDAAQRCRLVRLSAPEVPRLLLPLPQVQVYNVR